jgi:hypothetical protein
MKLIILIALVIAAAYFYPQINEDSDSPCAALEKRFVRDAFTGSDGGDLWAALLSSGVTNGAIAASMVKSTSPNLPAALGCMRSYYELMFNPELARDVMKVKQ